MAEQLPLFGLTKFEEWTRNVLFKYPTTQRDALSDFSIMRQNGKDLADKTPGDVVRAIERLVELNEVTIDVGVIRRIQYASD